MAESEVVETTPESQDSEKYAGGNGSPSGGTSTEGGPTEENNADSTESSPHEQTESSPHERIYMNFEVDPNRKGGSVGEGAQKDVSHPKGADTQSLGQINKGEHDNQGNGDPSVVDGNFHDNCPGSTVTEKNAPPDTKGGDTKFQESDIQDSHDDSEEPMDEGAPDTGDEPQVRSNKPDSIEQSEDDSEMDVDDATGQPSTAAKSGTEHATERENEGDGQGGNSVGEPKQTVERKDDGIGLGVSSDVGSEQKHTVEKSPAEATGETKCTTEGKNDGSGQAGTEAGNTQTRTTEEIDESLAGTAGESNHAVEGENNEVGSPAGTGSKQKHKTKGMDGGNRRGRSHAGARTKREVPPQKKDDDDHDSRYGRSWASRDTQRYRSGYQVSRAASVFMCLAVHE